MEVGLPDEAGREQIFVVHTRGFKSERCLASDVKFKQLARLTPNYTGAEIEGVVKGGLSFALQRQVSEESASSSAKPLSLHMMDLLKALGESKPHYGANHDWALHKRLGFVPFRPEVEDLQTKLLSILSQSLSGGHPLITILLCGPPGAGKSAWLAHLGALSKKFTFRRHVTGQELVGMGDESACEALVQAVTDAHQCPHSLLLLDELEALMQYMPLQGGRVSSSRSHTLLSLLSRAPKTKGRTGVVVATTSMSEETLKAVGLWEKFNIRFNLPLVETKQHLEALGVKEQVAGGAGRAPAPVREVLQRATLSTMSTKENVDGDNGENQAN